MIGKAPESAGAVHVIVPDAEPPRATTPCGAEGGAATGVGVGVGCGGAALAGPSQASSGLATAMESSGPVGKKMGPEPNWAVTTGVSSCVTAMVPPES